MNKSSLFLGSLGILISKWQCLRIRCGLNWESAHVDVGPSGAVMPRNLQTDRKIPKFRGIQCLHLQEKHTATNLKILNVT
jgi:hypothetical protein